MKKGFTLILTLCMMLALASPVYADVIWEPYGDSFYEEHRGEFRLCEDYYYANSPTGWEAKRARPSPTERLSISVISTPTAIRSGA